MFTGEEHSYQDKGGFITVETINPPPDSMVIEWLKTGVILFTLLLAYQVLDHLTEPKSVLDREPEAQSKKITKKPLKSDN